MAYRTHSSLTLSMLWFSGLPVRQLSSIWPQHRLNARPVAGSGMVLMRRQRHYRSGAAVEVQWKSRATPESSPAGSRLRTSGESASSIGFRPQLSGDAGSALLQVGIYRLSEKAR